MRNKEKFVLMVSVHAIARDICRNTKESEMIMEVASRIPSSRIPQNGVHAAKIFIQCVETGAGPARWMQPTQTKTE